MHPLDDTIAAIASPPGGAARGIVRLSGPRAIDCLLKRFQPADGQSLVVRFSPLAVAGELRLPELHAPLPCEVYLWPERSYTGQPVAEIHTLGSPPLLELVLRSICAVGARVAEPGEFTLRAFLAGRIDMTQAEAVLGVIDAGSSRELEIALRQLAGGLTRPLHQLRDGLLDLLADVEAGLDFADEDLVRITRDELNRRLATAHDHAKAILRQTVFRREATHGLRAVLIGWPNTGKSSLFNVMVGDQAALISDRPGTTRDYLVADLDLDGVKCQLIDTAGTRDEGRGTRDEGRGTRDEGRGTRDEERGTGDEGWAVHRPLNCSLDDAAQSAAAAQRRGAHVELFCLDSSRPLNAWEEAELARPAAGPRIVVSTKCDLPRRIAGGQAALETSSATGLGIVALREELRRQALAAGASGVEVVAGTAARCAHSLRLAGRSLRRARRVAAAGREELAAAEIRTALEELGKVAGHVYTEDVLDRVFSRFCVGK